MSTTPATENVTIKRDGTVLRNDTPLGTVERAFPGSTPWTFTDANGYGTDDAFHTRRAAVAALLRRADRTAAAARETARSQNTPAGTTETVTVTEADFIVTRCPSDLSFIGSSAVDVINARHRDGWAYTESHRGETDAEGRHAFTMTFVKKAAQ